MADGGELTMAAFQRLGAYLYFSSSVLAHRRYFRSNEDNAFIEAVLATTSTHLRFLEPGLTVWRAQLGHDEREDPSFPGSFYHRVECPFPAMRMKPRRDKAREGRANAKGIPVLYVAEQKETAIAEVRPWVGALVSVARLRVNQQVLVVDCTMDQPRIGSMDVEALFKEQLPMTPRDLEQYAWSDIDDAFSRPVSGSDDVAEYAPTQILAEAFRHKGYSGVAYRSSLGDGLNIALFSLEDADVLERRLVRIESVNIESWDVSDSSVVDIPEETG